jgi:large subunit ribosomal protein L18
VFRSAKHIYVQAIDDTTGAVLAAASDLEAAVKAAGEGKDKKAKAREVGKAIGAKLLAKQVSSVVFDRNGYLYHGRVARVADGAREAGWPSRPDEQGRITCPSIPKKLASSSTRSCSSTAWPRS